MYNDLVCYVIVRNDLASMNPGKAMSQCHHAGVQMMAKHGNKRLVQDYVKEGLAQGAVYFNTTIVLSACINRINNALLMAAPTDFVFDRVIDPSYPFIVESEEIANLIPQTNTTKIIKVLNDGRVLMVREQVTMAWFLGDRNNEAFRKLFEGLDLHP